MGKKPVLGMAGLLLASVALCGCKNSSCCSGGGSAPVASGHAWGGQPKSTTGSTAVTSSGVNPATGMPHLGSTPTTGMGNAMSPGGSMTGTTPFGNNQFRPASSTNRPTMDGSMTPGIGVPARPIAPTSSMNTQPIGLPAQAAPIRTDPSPSAPITDSGSGSLSKYPAIMPTTPSVGGVAPVPADGPAISPIPDQE